MNVKWTKVEQIIKGWDFKGTDTTQDHYVKTFVAKNPSGFNSVNRTCKGSVWAPTAVSISPTLNNLSVDLVQESE